MKLQIKKKSGLTGLEPATSAVTGRCSNQLNYNPKSCQRQYAEKSQKKQIFYAFEWIYFFLFGG